MLSREDILKLAKLSRLKLSDADVDSVSKHLDKMLDHMEALRKLDLSKVEPMTSAEDATTLLREDVPQLSLSHEQAFMNAPAVENEHFAIPKVIGG